MTPRPESQDYYDATEYQHALDNLPTWIDSDSNAITGAARTVQEYLDGSARRVNPNYQPAVDRVFYNPKVTLKYIAATPVDHVLYDAGSKEPRVLDSNNLYETTSWSHTGYQNSIMGIGAGSDIGFTRVYSGGNIAGIAMIRHATSSGDITVENVESSTDIAGNTNIHSNSFASASIDLEIQENYTAMKSWTSGDEYLTTSGNPTNPSMDYWDSSVYATEAIHDLGSTFDNNSYTRDKLYSITTNYASTASHQFLPVP